MRERLKDSCYDYEVMKEGLLIERTTCQKQLEHYEYLIEKEKKKITNLSMLIDKLER